MRKAIVLTAGLGLALMGFAEPAIKDRSVLGWWRFDSEGEKDVSGYGGGSYDLGTGVYAQRIGSGSYNGSGYVNINTKAKTFTATLANEAAGLFHGSTTVPYYTFVMRFRGDKNMAKLPDAYKSILGYEIVGYKEAHFGQLANDHDHWHQVALRYQKGMGTNSDYAYMAVCDYNIGDQYPAEAASNDVDFPLKVDGVTLKIGGNMQSSSYPYYGDVDEVMVVNRMLSKTELTRLYQTGETYVYPVGSQPGYSSETDWSSNEVNWKPKPGDMPGATYIVDDNKTMTQGGTATFGANVANQVSLTLGRLAPLKNVLTGETLVSNTQGNFSQGAGSAITFYDLRLNDGTYTAGGTSLTTTLLDVDAPASKPFSLSAAGDFALNVGEDTTGSGVLAKTGAGKLTVGKWTGTAKLRLAAGSIKTPRLDGYTGGTVLVSTGSTVAFTGDDVLPPEGKKMQIAFDGAKPTAKTAVMTVPDGVTATMIEDVTAYDGGKVGNVTVENGMVFVEPGFPEDMGAVPVLMVE